MAGFLEQLAGVELRYEEMTHLLSQPEVAGDNQRYTALMKEYTALTPLVDCWLAYRKAEDSCQEARELLEKGGLEKDFREMVEEELALDRTEMEERERAAGVSGYTFKKSLSLWLNGFTAFSVKPLRIATVIGALCAFLGFLFGFWVVVRKVCNPDILAGYSSMMALLLFIGGIIMLMLGLIGEYIGRIYICINQSPQYVIRQIINIEDGPERGTGGDDEG